MAITVQQYTPGKTMSCRVASTTSEITAPKQSITAAQPSCRSAERGDGRGGEGGGGEL